MAAFDASVKLKRINIPYFEGVNTLVDDNLAKKTELYRAENVRSAKIGSIEKREGKAILGDDISAAANYGIFYFKDENSASNKMYRISTVGGNTKIHYLNTSNVWTALSDADAVKLLELGDSTTQFDITLTGGTTYRYTWDTTGTDPDIDAHMRKDSIIVIAAQNFAAGNKGTFTVTAVAANYFEVTNASGVVESNKTIGTGSITVTSGKFSFVNAENCMFLVNGHADNRSINSAGTVQTSTDATGHLYNSPKAHLINYYKDRLYAGDYIVGDTRYKNGVMRSSVPLGLITLAEGDYAITDTVISVSDTKYIRVGDVLQIYRGGVFIENLTVTEKTQSTITVASITQPILSADEIWVNGTYVGLKKFRWADNPSSGEDVKQYDTFKLTGADNDELTIMTNINDVMLIGNKKNLAIWNDSNLRTFDLGIGCVSKKGWIKHKGVLFFVDHSGLYATSGDAPTLLSSKMEDYFKGATKTGLENACIGKKGMSIFIHIGDVTLYKSDGSVDKILNDTVLEYNVQQENCFPHTGIKADEFSTYVESTDADKLLFTMNDSANNDYEAYELLYKSSDLLLDAEIEFLAATQNVHLSNQYEKFSYPKAIIIEVSRGSGIQSFVSLDDEDFFPLEDAANKGINIVKIVSKSEESNTPRCHKLRVSLREYSNRICKINTLGILYSETEEESTI